MKALFHLLNIADWAMMLAGMAAALLMILVGSDSEPQSGNRDPESRERRRQSRKINSSADHAN
jgi:hypothetical protein